MWVITIRLLEGLTLEPKREMAGEEVRRFRRDLIRGRF
jgi:hypothetical protein